MQVHTELGKKQQEVAKGLAITVEKLIKVKFKLTQQCKTPSATEIGGVCIFLQVLLPQKPLSTHSKDWKEREASAVIQTTEREQQLCSKGSSFDGPSFHISTMEQKPTYVGEDQQALLHLGHGSKQT